MFNPLTFLVPPAVIVLSIPISLFAVLTTTIAICVLTVRVSIVYVELAIAILHDWLFGTTPSTKHPSSPSPSLPIPSSPLSNRPRSRRGSAPYASSAYAFSTSSTAIPLGMSARNESFTSLIDPSGTGLTLNRDFEGVAGWKDTATNENDEAAIWIGRLELPTGIPGDYSSTAGSGAAASKRRHQRSHTAGSLYRRPSTAGSVSIRPSPSQSQVRTPAATGGSGGAGEGSEEYFSMQPSGGHPNPSLNMRRPVTAEGPRGGKDSRRRKNSSGSSSSGGSRLTLSAVKHPGA